MLPLYPGPVFVACGTNTGEGLEKLVMCSDIHALWDLGGRVA